MTSIHITLVGVLAFGCGSSGVATPTTAKRAEPEVAVAGPGRLFVKGAGYEGVIIDHGEWTPSPHDVADVEVVLGPALAGHEMGMAYPSSDFKREYSGLTVESKRVIDVLLACQASGWPSQPLPSLKGGGVCYGRARFDVASRTITLWANDSK